MTVLSFTHNGQYGLDDVDVGKEVGLKSVLHQHNGLAALRQFFDGTDDG